MTKDTKNFDLDPKSNLDDEFPSYDEVLKEQEMDWFLRKETTIQVGPRDVSAPFITPEEEAAVKNYRKVLGTNLKTGQESTFESGSHYYHKDDAWIQTYSGRRFNPTNPYVDAIVIQDIAHSLSMQCRFSGHVKKFYSVAQHSVLVSYICDSADALWGLMHDASEAYLVDVPRPLKRSGKFDAYLEFEDKMQRAVCKRFGLPEAEPASVKRADKILLSTEARDLMSPLHPDWVSPTEPLPFLIDPMGQQDAKNLFMKRFFQLTGASDSAYNHYLSTQT